MQIEREYNLLMIVPARKGSKRLPHKNRKKIEGVSLTERSINHAFEIGQELNRKFNVVLTTDDKELLKEIQPRPNLVKEERPTNLARDNTRMIDVIRDLYERHGNTDSVTVLLQPTTPFRDTKRIAKYIRSVIQRDNSKEFTIVATREAKDKPAHIYESKRGLLSPLIAELAGRSMNSQELPKYYVLSGALYVFWKDYFLEKNKIMGDKIYNYKTRGIYAIDIDTEEDLNKIRRIHESN